MNLKTEFVRAVAQEFPSPTGVNYYELKQLGFNGGVFTINGFPSPTGVNYYELLSFKQKSQSGW